MCNTALSQWTEKLDADFPVPISTVLSYTFNFHCSCVVVSVLSKEDLQPLVSTKNSKKTPLNIFLRKFLKYIQQTGLKGKFQSISKQYVCRMSWKDPLRYCRKILICFHPRSIFS